MRTLSLMIAALFLIIAPGLLFAEGAHKFSVKGYELDLKWMHKLNEAHQDMFEIHGYTTKGEACNKLEVQVAFSNDNYKDNVPIVRAIIENYKPDAKNEFRGETPVKTESEHIPSWGVIDYNVKCLE